MLGNKLLVGSVNGNHRHFAMGIQALSLGEHTYPGVTSRMLTNPIGGLDDFRQIMPQLEDKEALKVFVNVAYGRVQHAIGFRRPRRRVDDHALTFHENHRL